MASPISNHRSPTEACAGSDRAPRTRRTLWKPLLIIWTLSGCAAHGIPRILPVSSPEELIGLVRSSSDSLEDLETRASLSMEIDGVRQNGEAVLFYRRPADLRLEVGGSLGVSVLSARFRNDTLAVFLPRNNQYIDGDAAEVLYRVTGVNFGYYDPIQAILGLPALAERDRCRIVEFNVQGPDYFLAIQDPFWRRRIRIDRRTATVREERIVDARGRTLSTRLFGDYRLVRGVVLPHRVEIRQGANHIRITARRVRVNTGIPNGRFVLTVPDQAERLHLNQNH